MIQRQNFCNLPALINTELQLESITARNDGSKLLFHPLTNNLIFISTLNVGLLSLISQIGTLQKNCSLEKKEKTRSMSLNRLWKERNIWIKSVYEGEVSISRKRQIKCESNIGIWHAILRSGKIMKILTYEDKNTTQCKSSKITY